MFGTRDRHTLLTIVQRALKNKVLECTLDDRKEGCRKSSDPFLSSCVPRCTPRRLCGDTPKHVINRCTSAVCVEIHKNTLSIGAFLQSVWRYTNTRYQCEMRDAIFPCPRVAHRSRESRFFPMPWDHAWLTREPPFAHHHASLE
jgi:hypothetical protein